MFSDDTIKIFLIILFSYMFYLNISNWQVRGFKKIGTGVVFCIVSTFIIRVLSLHITEPFKSCIIILTSSIFLKIVTKDSYKITCFNMTLGLASSYLLFMLSSFIAPALLYFTNREIEDNIDYKILFVVLVIETILFILFTKKKNKVFLPENKTVERFAVFFSLLIILFYSIFREGDMENKSFYLLLSGVVICIVGLAAWMKAESIIAFNETVGQNERNKLINSIDEAQSELKKLYDTTLDLEKKPMKRISVCLHIKR